MGVHFFHRAVARRRQNGHLSVGDDSFALLPAGRAGPGQACRPVYCRYAQMPSASLDAHAPGRACRNSV